MYLKLPYCPHLDQDTGDAIEEHRARLEKAVAWQDRPLQLGASKKLVESIARAVLDAKGEAVGKNMDFDPLVNRAHEALERQPGPGISMLPDVRTIASSAKKMVLSVRALRSEYGTGHGRSHLGRLDEEVATVATEAALLWSRWALRRLEHVLVGEADVLIRAVRETVLSRAYLREHLEAVMLPDQPAPTQHALGVAFGQRAASGTFVANEAGVRPPAQTSDLNAWPAPYRLGVFEGMVIDRSGSAFLDLERIPILLQVLEPVPKQALDAGLHEVADKVREAGRPGGSQTSDTALIALVGAMEAEAPRFEEPARSAWLELVELFRPAAAAS